MPTIEILEKHHYDGTYVGGDYHAANEAVPAREYEEADGIADVVRWLIRDRNDALRTVTEWQAVAGKKDDVLRKIASGSADGIDLATGEPSKMDWWANLAQSTLSTTPAAALLDELERAWKEGHARLAPLSQIPAETVHAAWLASVMRQRAIQRAGMAASGALGDSAGQDSGAPR